MEIVLCLLSGFAGAVLALVGNLLVSKHTTETQMKIAVLNTFLSARLDAYKALEIALCNWSHAPARETCAEVYRAVNVTSMVATEGTISKLAIVQNAVRHYETSGETPDLEKFGIHHVALLESMHHDLLSYQAPAVLLKRD